MAMRPPLPPPLGGLKPGSAGLEAAALVAAAEGEAPPVSCTEMSVGVGVSVGAELGAVEGVELGVGVGEAAWLLGAKVNSMGVVVAEAEALDDAEDEPVGQKPMQADSETALVCVGGPGWYARAVACIAGRGVAITAVSSTPATPSRSTPPARRRRRALTPPPWRPARRAPSPPAARG